MKSLTVVVCLITTGACTGVAPDQGDLDDAADPAGQVASEGRVAIASLPHWLETLGPDRVTCAELAEQPGIFICGARDPDSARRMFGSVVEGVGETWDASTHAMCLLDSHFATYLAGAEARTNCAAPPCLSASERELVDVLIRPRGSRPYAVIVTWIGDKTGDRYRQLYTFVHHELLHGQYHLTPAYRRTVAGFWSQLSHGAQQAITDLLLQLGYATESVPDEFQAYLLNTPQLDRFGAFFRRIGVSSQDLVDALVGAGTRPLPAIGDGSP
jgi:hypothetical protein